MTKCRNNYQLDCGLTPFDGEPGAGEPRATYSAEPETSRHNLDVLSVARAALGAKDGSLEFRVFDALGIAYRDAMATEKPAIPSELSSAMQALLGNKGLLKPDDHPELAEALDKPATTTT